MTYHNTAFDGLWISGGGAEWRSTYTRPGISASATESVNSLAQHEMEHDVRSLRSHRLRFTHFAMLGELDWEILMCLSC